MLGLFSYTIVGMKRKSKGARRRDVFLGAAVGEQSDSWDSHGRPQWINVHCICFNYPLAYLKYINCYAIAAYMSAYVKFATKYVTTANVSK